MTTFALFVKVGGKWQFAGLEENEEHVSEFEDRVEHDIVATKTMEVKTTAYRVVEVGE